MSNNTPSTYNGWSNRETWLASLWITSDPTSDWLLDQAVSRRESIPLQAEWLSEQIHEGINELELEASLASDLLSTALDKIDWQEIIESHLE